MKDNVKRCPTNGTFELTGRCNLSCKMCLVRVDQKRMDELGLRERTADEWIHMAEQAAKAGTLGLLLTGGEVMLRPDFCEIYEAIAKMGFLLTVYTNATMVTDRVMELFRRYPPHKIGVTMYGASNETYQRLCGCPDGYDRFVEGTRQLSGLPSLLDTRTTIVKDNLADLPAMKEFTARTFGADKVLHISRNVVNTVRGGIACPRQVRLAPEENVDLVYPWLRELEEKVQSGELKPVREHPPKLNLKRHQLPEEGRYLFEHCGAGRDQYAINWAGRMYACEMMPAGYTEPFEEGFDAAWARLPEQYPASRIPEGCVSCQYAALCESCPANRMAETVDWFGIPEYACREARCVYRKLSELAALGQ
ncbi:MAG: radical SAM protein [Candidatus Onthomonas sp.]